VWRCVNLLSTVVASCPIKVWNSQGEPQRVPILSPYHSWVDTKGISHDPLYTPYELWNLVTGHMALWGNAFVYKTRNQADSIIDLRPIDPSRVKVKLEPETKEKIFEVKRVDQAGHIMPVDPNIYTTYEVMHIPGWGYDGLTGLSPIGVAMETFGTAKAADRLASKFLGNGTQLSGIIKVKAPLKNQEQAEGIRSRWLNRHGGAGSAGGVAVMDAETDFQPITIPPNQLQFLESRRWETTEIARMFGIPPHLVGDVEKSTSWGTGIEQQTIGFVAFTISDYTNRIEQRVTREIVDTRGQYAEFDLDRLMRGSTTERYSAYHQALAAGWITANEVRAKENMQPAEGAEGMDLDKPFPPAGLTALNPPGGSQPGVSPEPEGS
jgi:HK97 family phage portal protein